MYGDPGFQCFDGGVDLLRVNVIHKSAVPYTLWQWNPLQPVPVTGTLLQGSPQQLGVENGCVQHDSESSNQIKYPAGRLIGQQVAPPGNERGDGNIEQNRLAVEQMSVGTSLQPVAECMPKIHLARQVFLEQIWLQLFQHSANGAVKEHAAFLILELGVNTLRPVRFQQAKQVSVFDYRQLDNLAYAVQDMASG